MIRAARLVRLLAAALLLLLAARRGLPVLLLVLALLAAARISAKKSRALWGIAAAAALLGPPGLLAAAAALSSAYAYHKLSRRNSSSALSTKKLFFFLWLARGEFSFCRSHECSGWEGSRVVKALAASRGSALGKLAKRLAAEKWSLVAPNGKLTVLDARLLKAASAAQRELEKAGASGSIKAASLSFSKGCVEVRIAGHKPIRLAAEEAEALSLVYPALNDGPGGI